MLATQSQRLTWRDTLSFGLWQAARWAASTWTAWPRLMHLVNPAPATVSEPTAASLVIDGVAYIDVGRRYPIRADRFESFYCAADE